MTPDRVPFCWQDKRVLRRIREQCTDPGSALGVYQALTVAASDAQCEEFKTTHAWLASLSGFSARTVFARLRDLVQIKAIEVRTPALKAPSVFKLLPFGNDCGTSGNGCRTLGNGEGVTVANIRKMEQSKEKRMARPEESNQATPTAPTPPPGDSDAPTAAQGSKAGHPDNPVELPPGFPKTEAEAKAAGAMAGCDPEQALKFWNDALQADGKNMFGQRIGRYSAYLASRLAAERSRAAERASRPVYGKPPRIEPNHADPLAWSLDRIKGKKI